MFDEQSNSSLEEIAFLVLPVAISGYICCCCCCLHENVPRQRAKALEVFLFLADFSLPRRLRDPSFLVMNAQIHFRGTVLPMSVCSVTTNQDRQEHSLVLWHSLDSKLECSNDHD
jgi:hypothetical protein